MPEASSTYQITTVHLVHSGQELTEEHLEHLRRNVDSNARAAYHEGAVSRDLELESGWLMVDDPVTSVTATPLSTHNASGDTLSHAERQQRVQKDIQLLCQAGHPLKLHWTLQHTWDGESVTEPIHLSLLLKRSAVDVMVRQPGQTDDTRGVVLEVCPPAAKPILSARIYQLGSDDPVSLEL